MKNILPGLLIVGGAIALLGGADNQPPPAAAAPPVRSEARASKIEAPPLVSEPTPAPEFVAQSTELQSLRAEVAELRATNAELREQISRLTVPQPAQVPVKQAAKPAQVLYAPQQSYGSCANGSCGSGFSSGGGFRPFGGIFRRR